MGDIHPPIEDKKSSSYANHIFSSMVKSLLTIKSSLTPTMLNNIKIPVMSREQLLKSVFDKEMLISFKSKIADCSHRSSFCEDLMTGKFSDSAKEIKKLAWQSDKICRNDGCIQLVMVVFFEKELAKEESLSTVKTIASLSSSNDSKLNTSSERDETKISDSEESLPAIGTTGGSDKSSVDNSTKNVSTEVNSSKAKNRTEKGPGGKEEPFFIQCFKSSCSQLLVNLANSTIETKSSQIDAMYKLYTSIYAREKQVDNLFVTMLTLLENAILYNVAHVLELIYDNRKGTVSGKDCTAIRGFLGILLYKIFMENMKDFIFPIVYH